MQRQGFASVASNMKQNSPPKEKKPKVGIDKFIADDTDSDNDSEMLDEFDDEFGMMNLEDQQIVESMFGG